jgi:hypothetical protein
MRSKNGNLEFSISYLTQLWSMLGCRTSKCVAKKKKSKCNEYEGIQNWFCQKPMQIKTTVCTEADHGILTQL